MQTTKPHKFTVTGAHADEMRELVKKHSAITWKESRGWVYVDFEGVGPAESMAAFVKEFEALELQWIGDDAW